MQSFQKQYVTCRNAGYHYRGKLKKYKDHPEQLPAPFCRMAAKLAKELLENPDAGMYPIMCGRFGGECSGTNIHCKALRHS